MDREAITNYDLDAEVSVLAAMMLDDDFAREAVPQLAVEDFARLSHKSIFVAISALVAKGRPCDQVSVADMLRAKGSKVDKAELISIADNMFAMTSCRHHLKIVKRWSMQRKLVAFSVELRAMAEDPHEDIETVRDLAISKLREILGDEAGC